MADLKKFYRLTDLFTRGKPVVIGTPGYDAMVVWVTHLNAFERSEVQKDGAAGRAKRLHLMRPEDDEMVIVEQTIIESDRTSLIDQLVRNKANDNYMKALDEIRTDKEWREKIEALERGDQLLKDQGDAVDDQEVTRLAELNSAYLDELNRIQAMFDEETRAETENLTDEEVREAFRDSVRTFMATSAWLEEARISEIYYALRECNADPHEPHIHTSCDHSVKLCPTRADVRALPDLVINAVRDAINELTVPLRDAGNSDAPRSSSASSERQDVAEESTLSTPSGT